MNNSPGQILKTIRIIHLALMAGPLFFAATVFVISSTGFSSSSGSIEVLNYAVPTLFLLVFIGSEWLYKNALKNGLSNNDDLKKKLYTFQTAHIIRLALLEGSALFAGIAALLNNNVYFLIIVLLIVALMFTKMPSIMRLEVDLALTQEEKDKLQGLL